MTKTASAAAVRAKGAAKLHAINLRTAKRVAFLEGKEAAREESSFWAQPGVLIPLTVVATLVGVWVTKELMKLEVVQR